MSTFDELSRSIDVLDSEITHLALGEPWGKHRRSEAGRARLYAALDGQGLIEAPGQRVHLRAGELLFLSRADEHVIRDAPRRSSRATAAPAWACARWARMPG